MSAGQPGRATAAFDGIGLAPSGKVVYNTRIVWAWGGTRIKPLRPHSFAARPVPATAAINPKGLFSYVKMKKLACCLLAALLMVGAFAGCSDRGEESPAAQSGSESQASSTPPDQGESSQNQADAGESSGQSSGEEVPALSVNLVQFQDPQPGDTIAVMKTTMGEIRIRLFPQYAPYAVENFKVLAEAGYYDGRNFHRVIPDFMIQAGSLDGQGHGGKSIYQDADGNEVSFPDEFTLDLWNFRGALSMANSGPNTNSSQFFIVQRGTLGEGEEEYLRERQYPEAVIEKYKVVGGTHHLDFVHTVFGFVLEGMDVVDAIAAVERDANDHPLEEVLIESITFETVE